MAQLMTPSGVLGATLWPLLDCIHNHVLKIRRATWRCVFLGWSFKVKKYIHFKQTSCRFVSIIFGTKYRVRLFKCVQNASALEIPEAFVAVVKNVNLSHKFLESRKRVVGLTGGGGLPLYGLSGAWPFGGQFFIGTEILGVDLLSGLRILGSIFYQDWEFWGRFFKITEIFGVEL